jgi:hypothetical protein
MLIKMLNEGDEDDGMMKRNTEMIKIIMILAQNDDIENGEKCDDGNALICLWVSRAYKSTNSYENNMKPNFVINISAFVYIHIIEIQENSNVSQGKT